MKQQTERFTPAALTLSLVTAALADGIPQSVPVRRALWLGVVSAVCLCILSALAVAMLQNKAPSLAVRLALTAGLFMELMHTLVQAQGLCTAEFSSMALLGFLPLLLWAGWAVPPASWNASARVLWWFAAVGGVVCLLGLAGQLHWYRLFTPAQPTAANWDIPVYAEYFAGALLCSARSARRTVWLPVWGFAVQAAALLGSALLFGSETYPRLELLRAWSSGSFSRMDALLLLLWLSTGQPCCVPLSACSGSSRKPRCNHEKTEILQTDAVFASNRMVPFIPALRKHREKHGAGGVSFTDRAGVSGRAALSGTAGRRRCRRSLCRVTVCAGRGANDGTGAGCGRAGTAPNRKLPPV